MEFQYTPYLFLPAIAAVVALVVGIVAARRRPVPTAKPLMWMGYAAAFWAAAYTLEIAAKNRSSCDLGDLAAVCPGIYRPDPMAATQTAGPDRHSSHTDDTPVVDG
jgi:hypothetical protein